MQTADDVCECGDYRHQHKDGSGVCCFNKPNGIGHGLAPNCEKFRPAKLQPLPNANAKTPDAN